MSTLHPIGGIAPWRRVAELERKLAKAQEDSSNSWKPPSSGIVVKKPKGKGGRRGKGNRQATAEFTGACGVFHLMTEFGPSVDEALVVSDHLPVWAEFSAGESTVVGPVTMRPARGK